MLVLEMVDCLEDRPRAPFLQRNHIQIVIFNKLLANAKLLLITDSTKMNSAWKSRKKSTIFFLPF